MQALKGILPSPTDPWFAMKLSRIFQSKSAAFREAVKTDDLPRMEELMQKKGYGFFFEILSGEYVADLTPRMAALLVEKLDDKVLQRWQMKPGSKGAVVDAMLSNAIFRDRLPVAEFLMENAGVKFNGRNGGGHLEAVLISGLADDVKLRFLKKMLARGYDRMEKTDKAMQVAVDKNFLPAIDLFAAVGFDVHKKNEQYLRAAAKNKSPATALHLVTRHGADIDLAISTEMAVGNAPAFEFLAALKKQLPAAQNAPRTVESMAAEIGSLQDTVRELTQKLARMEGGASLDKPVLKSPAP